MKSAILFLCFSGLAMGHEGTCSDKDGSCVTPEGDETFLMQVRAQVHKHSPEMGQVLASFEKKEGPAALQELMHGLMSLPRLEKDEAMLEAVYSHPRLQMLSKRFPELMRGLGIFEDAKAVQQIRAAMIQASDLSPVKKRVDAQATSLQSDTPSLLGKSKVLEDGDFYWMKGWGCETVVVTVHTPDSTPEFRETPLFNTSECSGWPWVMDASKASDGSFYYAVSEWKDDGSGTWVGTYTIKSTGAAADTVIPVAAREWINGAFSGDAFNYIHTKGEWPDYTYELYKVLPEHTAVSGVMTTIKDCLYPWQVKGVGKSLLWTCAKDWSDTNSTSTLMKYEHPETSIIDRQAEYYGFLTTTPPNKVYYSVWAQKEDSWEWEPYLYSGSLSGSFSKVGAMPSHSAWDFIVAKEGDLIVPKYEWGDKGEVKYEVHDFSGLGTNSTGDEILFTYNGYVYMIHQDTSK